MEIKEEQHFQEQQKSFLESVTQFETLDSRMMFHLYNPETNLFILNILELKPGKYIKY
jgi:hypothetical protein